MNTNETLSDEYIDSKLDTGDTLQQELRSLFDLSRVVFEKYENAPPEVQFKDGPFDQAIKISIVDDTGSVRIRLNTRFSNFIISQIYYISPDTGEIKVAKGEKVTRKIPISFDLDISEITLNKRKCSQLKQIIKERLLNDE